jgi:D-aminopeptidase
VSAQQPRRARDLGLVVGRLAPGEHNAITDVAGVRVGHAQARDATGAPVCTGVTAILPHDRGLARERLYAAVSALNGYGQLTGSFVVEEWGVLGSPIVLTDTVHVGVAYDAVMDHLLAQDARMGDIDVPMPVVGECDDGYLHDNRGGRSLTPADVLGALDEAASGPVPEGSVGAGTGMQMFDFKGGIGTASRVVAFEGERYTVGVLLNGNFGTRDQLRVLGAPLGQRLTGLMPERHHEGSCIAVVATDAPLHPRQLERMARRVDLGLGRTGSSANDGSGEIFLAFSTANPLRWPPAGVTRRTSVIAEGRPWTEGSALDLLFDAVAEATEEAALNALFGATTVTGRRGHVLHALPHDEALAILREWSPIGDTAPRRSTSLG